MPVSFTPIPRDFIQPPWYPSSSRKIGEAKDILDEIDRVAELELAERKKKNLLPPLPPLPPMVVSNHPWRPLQRQIHDVHRMPKQNTRLHNVHPKALVEL